MLAGREGLWRPVADHLWQSTLFVVLAALLAAALKRNHARTRFCLWFLSSVKFLVPLSLLAAFGSRLSWLPAAAAERTTFWFAIGGPFAANVSAVDKAVPPSLLVHYVPALVLLVWTAGSGLVLAFWLARWRRMAAATRPRHMQSAASELEQLRQAEIRAGLEPKIRLLTSGDGFEPGIVGIFRPVLVLPGGISERLSEAQLAAVMDHEICHVRRRDNLTAAVHAVVEAAFWFHPLVWWVGARMMEERERACDEEVLRIGNDAREYAEGILRVCKFYLEAPRLLAAGVGGSKLRNRIEAIMAGNSGVNLDRKRKWLLATIGAAAIVLPIANGVLYPVAGRAEARQQSASPAAKYVLGDIRLEGDMHDREFIRKRILEAWSGREFAEVRELTESVMQEGVRAEFQNRGYFKAVASEAALEPLGTVDEKQSIRLVTTVDDGAQYRVGAVTVAGVDEDRALALPATALRAQFHLETGDLADIREMRGGIDRVKKLYAEKGKSASVVPEFRFNDGLATLDIIFRVRES